VRIVLQKQDRFLLVQEQKARNYGRWNLPGGHLEFGGILQEGAIREVAEETGLRVKLLEVVGIYTGTRQSDHRVLLDNFS